MHSANPESELQVTIRKGRETTKKTQTDDDDDDDDRGGLPEIDNQATIHHVW